MPELTDDEKKVRATHEAYEAAQKKQQESALAAKTQQAPIVRSVATQDPNEFDAIIKIYNNKFQKDGKYIEGHAEPKIDQVNGQQCLVLSFASKQEAQDFFQELANNKKAFIVYGADGKEEFKSNGDGKLLAMQNGQWVDVANKTAQFKAEIAAPDRPAAADDGQKPPSPSTPSIG